MALTPVSVPSLNLRTSSPPGRPSGPAERLRVPGNPQAQVHRPEHAPGRIPVAAPTQADEQEPLKLIHDIDRQVKLSVEYQALLPFLRKAGLADEENGTSRAAQQAAEPTGQAQVEETAPATTAQTQSETVITWQISVTQVSMEMRVTRTEAQAPPVQRSDPLAFDLDGDGLETTGVANGVLFDINADGVMDRTSFVSGGDAFLALDRNGNGRIDDGSELFGDQNGDANGYQALSRYDDNSDGRIDRQDSVFQHLRLFSLSADGSQQQRSLEEAGISSINLAYRNSTTALNAYDTIAQQSSFERSDGTQGETGDLMLGFRESEQ